MNKKMSSLPLFLKSALEERQERNPHYSLRAFARDLGISPGACSDFLSGHRSPGVKLSKRIATALNISPEDAKEMFNLVEKQKKLECESGLGYQLMEEQFAIIANREHFAILNLMKTSNFHFDIEWMSRRLGFPEDVIQSAIQRMERLGLIRKENGQYLPVHRAVTTSHDIPSDTIKEHHRQNIRYTLDSLMNDHPSVRDITTITTATNPENIEKAKILIRKFRRKLVKILATGDKTEVYSLNIQLVPLTQTQDNDGKK